MDNDIRDEVVLAEFLRRANITPRKASVSASASAYTVYRVQVRENWVDFWFTKEGDYITNPPRSL